MKKIMKKKKGFTLIELVIVIAIIAILAAVAIPRYQKSKRSAAEAAHKSNVSMLTTAALMKQNDMGDSSATWTGQDDDSSTYVGKWPQLPKGLKFKNGSNFSSYKVTITSSSISVSPSVEDVDYSSSTNK